MCACVPVSPGVGRIVEARAADLPLGSAEPGCVSEAKSWIILSRNPCGLYPRPAALVHVVINRRLPTSAKGEIPALWVFAGIAETWDPCKG